MSVRDFVRTYVGFFVLREEFLAINEHWAKWEKSLTKSKTSTASGRTKVVPPSQPAPKTPSGPRWIPQITRGNPELFAALSYDFLINNDVDPEPKEFLSAPVGISRYFPGGVRAFNEMRKLRAERHSFLSLKVQGGSEPPGTYRLCENDRWALLQSSEGDRRISLREEAVLRGKIPPAGAAGSGKTEPVQRNPTPPLCLDKIRALGRAVAHETVPQGVKLTNETYVKFTKVKRKPSFPPRSISKATYVLEGPMLRYYISARWRGYTGSPSRWLKASRTARLWPGYSRSWSVNNRSSPLHWRSISSAVLASEAKLSTRLNPFVFGFRRAAFSGLRLCGPVPIESWYCGPYHLQNAGVRALLKLVKFRSLQSFNRFYLRLERRAERLRSGTTGVKPH